VYTALANDATLASLVGTRITPNTYAQATVYPAVEYSVDGGGAVQNLAGCSLTRNMQFEFDCRGSTYSSTVSTADAVEAALTAATTFSARVLNINDLPFSPGSQVHRRMLDVSIWGAS